MKMVNLANLPWEDWSSPGGKFHGSGQQISTALGAVANAPTGSGGHPFDLEHGRLKPGKSGCPFHSHSSQWELFIIRSGSGIVRHGSQRRAVQAGDAILHPPGPEAHQLINSGDVDLTYFLIADNPQVDVWHYPDSAKWGYRPSGGIFRKVPVDYNLDEEEGAPTEVEPTPLPTPTPAQEARFVAIDSIPEAGRSSPKQKYHSLIRDISLALGGIRNVGTWAGGHPFDVQQRRVPPGAAVCPFHSHTVQWELFIILEGQAMVRANDSAQAAQAGDAFIHAPGTAHQIRNTGGTDLVFYVVANNSPADSCYYPDSNKWMLDPPKKIFRMVEVDYFDGEE